MIDANEGVTKQDQRLAERVDAAGNPVVIVLNKWDLLDNEAKEQVRAQVANMLGFVSYAPSLEDQRPDRPRGCSGSTPALAIRPSKARYPPARALPTARCSTRRLPPPRRLTPPRTVRGCSTPRRERRTRRLSRSSPQRSCLRAISATWSARSGSASISGRRRSSCGHGAAPADAASSDTASSDSADRQDCYVVVQRRGEVPSRFEQGLAEDRRVLAGVAPHDVGDPFLAEQLPS